MVNESTVASELFTSNKNKKKSKGNYKTPIEASSTYAGGNEKVNETNDISLSKVRGTLRMPMEQKLEFDALLQISPDVKYVYELLAELVFSRVSTLPRDKRERYNETLNDLKQQEIKKLIEKNKKK